MGERKRATAVRRTLPDQPVLPAGRPMEPQSRKNVPAEWMITVPAMSATVKRISEIGSDSIMKPGKLLTERLVERISAPTQGGRGYG